MKKNFLLVFLFAFYLVSYSQDISGRILDTKGQPVIFAAVQNNESSGVITNEEGYFSITLDDNRKYLTISCLGFETIDVTLSALEANNYVIVLKEQVNELDTVFLSNSELDVDEIIRKANENLSSNYKNEGISYRLFYRGTEYNQFKKLEFEINKASGFKKRELTGVNQSLDSLTNDIKDSQSIDFTDYLADLMILDKENAKLDVVKATKLIDTKNSISVDRIQKRAQDIFLTYLDTTKTYKLKTGLLKIEDSLSLNDGDGKRNDKNEEVSALEYDTSNLKDKSHEHLHISQIYDGTTLRNLLDNDLYDYEYINSTMFNGELVHMIAYEPRRSKAKLEGMLFISDDSYAVIKADYKYAKGKRGEKLNLKLLLGIKFVENVKEGTIIFTRDEDYYQPKYIKEETGSYFYVNRPLKFIENSPSRRKVGFKFLIEGNNRNKSELLIVSQSDLDTQTFDEFSELEKTPYERLKAYDPTIWENYTSLEPLQEMKTFKAKE